MWASVIDGGGSELRQARLLTLTLGLRSFEFRWFERLKNLPTMDILVQDEDGQVWDVKNFLVNSTRLGRRHYMTLDCERRIKVDFFFSSDPTVSPFIPSQPTPPFNPVPVVPGPVIPIAVPVPVPVPVPVDDVPVEGVPFDIVPGAATLPTMLARFVRFKTHDFEPDEFGQVGTPAESVNTGSELEDWSFQSFVIPVETQDDTYPVPVGFVSESPIVRIPPQPEV